MQLTEHLCQMTEYNQWMNTKLYLASATLSAEELAKNRGAFFGSIIGTLNHIVVADILWLKRFTPALQAYQELVVIQELNQPKSLDEIVFSSLEELYERRKILDRILLSLAKSLTVPELNQTLSYTNTKGIASTKNLFSLLMHVFNHQTHHRGQVTTLLSQAGVDIGVSDLVAIIPNS